MSWISRAMRQKQLDRMANRILAERRKKLSTGNNDAML
jgi:hypothetical protein